MPTTPDWKQALETGMQFTEMRRAQARRIANDLVAQGQLARDQMSGAVDEIIEMSRRRREDVRELVRTEVERQLHVLGIATKADVARLEHKLSKVAKASKASAKKTAKPAKKSVKKPATTASKPAKAAAKKAG